ncbi:MAG: ExsB family protein [Cytophagaceae bacterium]|jgi:N-acetyl sugar amidotransferase|nr:ExsB family protein [Cytophagaceae bacterium]
MTAQSERPYQMCIKTVMDTTDPSITFDEQGICNYWYEYFANAKKELSKEDGLAYHESILKKIREKGKGKKYDCVIGLSGGADSSYLAYMAREWGLNPLLVHFDNGFNTATAVSNIEQIVKQLGFDLHTFVMDWEEFKDIQRSYFYASVLDLEIPNDHMIFASLYKVANDFDIKYIILGFNNSTEAILPEKWRYLGKLDLVNLKTIQKRFGKKPIKHMPKLGIWQFTYYMVLKGIKQYSALNFIGYDKEKAKEILTKELGWKDYGGKHHESVFTRFYQGYILPKKFNIDKRKAHLSTLICSGQMTREEALEELSKPTYDPQLQEEDKVYIAKKLGFSTEEFERLLTLPNVDHEVYGTDKWQTDLVFGINKFVKRIHKFNSV